MTARAESSGMRRMDWALSLSTAGLMLIGTVCILSAASPVPHFHQIVQRHLLAAAVGLAAFLFGFSVNYQIFQDQSRSLYALTLALMVLVLVAGETVRGHRSWFRLPFFALQPTELARACTILVIANYLDRRTQRVIGVATLAGAFALAAPVMGLILLQPDFSSTLLFFPILLTMLFCAGASLYHLSLIAAYGGIALGLPLLWTLLSLKPEMAESWFLLRHIQSLARFDLPLLAAAAGALAAAWTLWRLLGTMRVHVPLSALLLAACVADGAMATGVAVHSRIKDHQRKRFIAFLAPEADPQGATYNVRQALVAIGSGGFAGKGLFSGTQSQLGFLPERHTDFIFAVVGEEGGFLGAGLLLGLYCILLWRLLQAARIARDRYGYLVCCGIAASFGFSLLTNVGMCLGVIPVAGIPLPLISYGGSSLVASLWMIGIAANVYAKRYAFV